MTPLTLQCKEVVELVTELFGNALAPEVRARLEQHLLVCPPCTAHIRQVKSTIQLTRGLHDSTNAVIAPELLAKLRSMRSP